VRYALLIYADEKLRESAPAESVEQMNEAFSAFTTELAESGAWVGGEELQPTATATSVRLQGGVWGDVLTTDGPFAETKEQLGGFYVVECGDLDEAIELAARVPSAPFGTIEVRPLAEGPRPH
jgi:hypothetical protein